MKTRCLLVDDEPLALQLIKSHIDKLDNFEVVGSCPNAVKALEVLNSTQVDLLFLDIKMPGIIGLDFLKVLKNPPPVIITTAYREYAIQGYDLDIVDYLLKPITFERFFKSIERYLRLFARNENLQVQTNEPQPFIHIRSGGKVHRVAVYDIIYAESVKDYLLIHLKDRKVRTKYKIGDFEKDVLGQPFLRTHRSFIVNLLKVTAFTLYDVEIAGLEIPIGSSYKEYALKVLTDSALNNQD
ncbi:two-component system response regulator [Pedobacter ginsenosidimutans]|uniref:Two-component system response regulator n=1 Tax=Pedobacter ginsenosidimutans TaxID=687842 RepID=A0A0T5VVI3_9SPHI|nr:LytTR family DNA-binding domain-containing protein [Pedobacter ginsenosidimutans]KRT17878.1 two-component system response regulator [Pedobacter ginsenosidimutans]